MRSAIIYTGVSNNLDNQSTNRQMAALQAFAEKEGLEIMGIFEEYGNNAGKNKLGILQFFEFQKQEGCRVLLVPQIISLGRTAKEVTNTVDELTNVGVNVYIQSINLWTLLPDGSRVPMTDSILTTLALGAEMERKSRMTRLNSGREKAKKEGVKMGRPEGSRMSDKDLLAKYPEVAKKLRKGLSIRAVSKVCEVSTSTVQRVKKVL